MDDNYDWISRLVSLHELTRVPALVLRLSCYRYVVSSCLGFFDQRVHKLLQLPIFTRLTIRAKFTSQYIQTHTSKLMQ